MSEPKLKEPAMKTPFPPSGYLKAHRVQSGESWWSLQEKYGFKNAWDLIRYNFRTKNPDEVNWCLKNLVGCKLTTADGKNYRFSADAFPGLIYLPPRRFQRGVGGGDAGAAISLNAEEQTARNREARALVLTALGHVQALENVDFNIGGFTVNPNKLTKVRDHIRAGEITVRFDPNIWDMAYYDIDFDVIYLGQFSFPDTDAVKALIVHECTHAMMDRYKTPINDMQSEMMGYVAQMLFYLGRKPSATAPYVSDEADRNVLMPAFQYAKYLTDLRKGLAKSDPPSWSKAASALTKLAGAIMLHKAYEDQFKASEANNGLAGYDGIDGWSYEDPDNPWE